MAYRVKTANALQYDPSNRYDNTFDVYAALAMLNIAYNYNDSLDTAEVYSSMFCL